MTGKEKTYLRADSVDGRNPAPPVMYKTIKKKRETTTYQLVQEFFHQQFVMVASKKSP